MNWLWLNLPLAVVIFGAVTGIPLWMVIKHPDTGPDTARARLVVHSTPTTAPRSIVAHVEEGRVRTYTAA